MTHPADLITKAEAVTRLWDLVLFASGAPAARQKRAEVLHQAVLNLQEEIAKARGACEP
jgi:hypothetical protein